jgi:hypothetical protein
LTHRPAAANLTWTIVCAGLKHTPMFHGIHSPIGVVMPRLLEWVNDPQIPANMPFGSRNRSSFPVERYLTVLYRFCGYQLIGFVSDANFLGFGLQSVFSMVEIVVTIPWSGSSLGSADSRALNSERFWNSIVRQLRTVRYRTLTARFLHLETVE